MTTPRNAWWITLALLIGPALYLCYWVRQMALEQAPLMDTIALSIAEDGAAWEGIAFGDQHPLQVYQELRQTNEYMLVASSLAGVLLVAVAVMIAAAWGIQRWRNAGAQGG
jgi:hypothetical protein